MKIYRSVILQCLALMLLIFAANCNADQVTYFDRPASAEVIGEILWPKTEKSSAPEFYIDSLRGARGMEVSSTEASPNKDASINSTPERVGIGFPIAFDYNSSEINPEGKAFLNELGKSMNRYSGKDNFLIIEGHTDAFGSDIYNLRLSERRARAVKKYLMYNYNISPNKLRTSGLGETKPRDGVDLYDKTNRRVEFFSVRSN